MHKIFAWKFYSMRKCARDNVQNDQRDLRNAVWRNLKLLFFYRIFYRFFFFLPRVFLSRARDTQRKHAHIWYIISRNKLHAQNVGKVNFPTWDAHGDALRSVARSLLSHFESLCLMEVGQRTFNGLIFPKRLRTKTRERCALALSPPHFRDPATIL